MGLQYQLGTSETRYACEECLTDLLLQYQLGTSETALSSPMG